MLERLSIERMRVASQFNDCAVNSLKIYKVIEPNTWAKLVGRVNRINVKYNIRIS